MNEFFYNFLEVTGGEPDGPPLSVSLKSDAYSVLLNSSVVKLQGDSNSTPSTAVVPLSYKVTSSYRSKTTGGIFLNPNVSVYPSVVTTKREKVNDLLFVLFEVPDNVENYDFVRDVNAMLGSYVSASFSISTSYALFPSDGINTLLFIGKVSNNYDPEDSENTLNFVEDMNNVLQFDIVRPTASTASVDSFLLRALSEGSPLESSVAITERDPRSEKAEVTFQVNPDFASMRQTVQDPGFAARKQTGQDLGFAAKKL